MSLFLHTADGKDAGLCKVVLGDVVDTLLAEETFRTALFDLLDNALDHAFLFVEECLELVGVGDVDLGVDFGLLELDCCVEEQDLGVGDLLWHRGVDAFLVDKDAFDDFRVLDAAAGLLLDLDVVGVNGAVGLGDHGDCLNDEVAELVLACLGALAGHRGLRDLLEHRLVGRLNVDGDVL